MKMILIIAAAIVATTFTGTAHAVYFKNGNKLYKECSANPGDATGIDFWLCLGYVAGVTDTLDPANKCFPASVTVGQVQAVVMQYLQNHPEKRHLEASELVATAVQEAFCKS